MLRNAMQKKLIVIGCILVHSGPTDSASVHSVACSSFVCLAELVPLDRLAACLLVSLLCLACSIVLSTKGSSLSRRSLSSTSGSVKDAGSVNVESSGR